ncbi:uncharacterized protein LOC105662217 [Megachile rotundata]|uniref:uncharacterized protein LOC105662217 n=1 Tax=Megachile rotundata TaxID=143995 RepID=UPI000614B24C|nr:PREDICTED: uncharacterized protein LOC105662217 [Megachile rotundata]XP_012138580.1 PREDICTED: uncharacterized protein LOC105662217 [Megachile rotundata]
MKFYLSLLLVVLVAIPRHPTAANNVCPQENCLDSSKCESVVTGGTCPQSTDTCCSIVKMEHRTHCRHFAGECMDRCAVALQNPVDDCPSDKVCCTLV